MTVKKKVTKRPGWNHEIAIEWRSKKGTQINFLVKFQEQKIINFYCIISKNATYRRGRCLLKMHSSFLFRNSVIISYYTHES